MAKQQSNGSPKPIRVLSEARQELWALGESCRGLESAHADLECMLDSTIGSLDNLVEPIESLTEVLTKCLKFAETWGDRMDDWENRLAALEDAEEKRQDDETEQRRQRGKVSEL